MRTSLLAAALGLSLVACVGEVPGDPGGTGGSNSGSNGGSNSGSGGSGSNVDPVPAVALSVDHTTVTSDLGVDAVITVTATGSMGFSGAVNLTATAVDSTGAALTDWSVKLDQAALSLDTDGTATAKITVNLPGDVASLLGNIKVTATGSVTIPDATVAVTANPVLDVLIGDNGGKCVYPTQSSYNLKVGRTLSVTNGSSTLGLTVHSDGVDGFPHEGGVTGPGLAYKGSGPVQTAGQSAKFYCHDGNPNTLTNNGATGQQMTLHVVP